MFCHLVQRTIRRASRFPVVALCAFLLWGALGTAVARAATVEVDAGIAGSCCVYNTPTTGSNVTTINVGDTIHWVWKTNFHSVTSDTGAWADSGVHNAPFTFDVKFLTAGSFRYHCSIHGGIGTGMMGTINVVAPTTTVTGNIALEGVKDLSAVKAAAPLGTFHVSFRKPGTLTEMFGSDVTLTTAAGSANGGYSISGIAAGTYDVAIKGAKNLRVVNSGVVIGGATAAPPDTLLLAGDADDSNTADVLDFGFLVNAYGSDSSVPISGYDPTVDFNFDGVVDVLDFGLLVNNYGANGAL